MLNLGAVNLSQFKIWVFDLDGVIWRGDSVIPGAAAAVAALQARGCRAMFASNNSTRTPQYFADKLGKLGIRAAPADIVTSTTIAVSYLRAKFPGGGRIFIVGEAGLRAQLESAGFEVTQRNSGDLEDVIAVVAGLAREFCYADLARAQTYILSGALWVATNRDATFPVENGVLPGAGAVVAAIETASGQAPATMGKPQPTMLQQIVADAGLQFSEVVMVGDRLDTDIACAHRAGIASVWVATGVVGWETARAAQGEEKPDVLLNDLNELIARLDG